MNPNTGQIKPLSELSEKELEVFTVPVNLDEMTDEQKARYKNDEQPVVKVKDFRSALAQKREKALKDLNTRRAKNKRAKKSRKGNRK